MHGSLGEGVLPPLLRDLYVGRKTGYLYFSRPGRNCSVLFRNGHVVHATTDNAEDWLGETLVRHGLLSREHHQQAAAAAEQQNKRLGRVLCEQGLLDKERLAEGMALQVRQILFRVFSWTAGGYRFEELDDVSSHEVTLKVSTGDMILEGVRRVRDPEAVRHALGDMDRVLGLSADPLLRFQNLTLSPADVCVLSYIDGTLSAREIVQAAPLDAEEACRSLLGLLCTGVVEHVALSPRARAAAAKAARAAAPPPAAEPPQPPAGGPEGEARRREVLDAFEGLRARTHYELLGVPHTAGEEEIKQAYFRLAKRFHPDAHHDAGLSDLRARLEAVFIALGHAYETLREPHSRARYDATLPRRATPAAPSSAPAPPPDPGWEKKVAADNVRKAEKHLAEAQYWDSIQLFESALEHVEGKLRQRALLGLSRALLKNPNWVKRAEETLQELLREEPRHVEALLELALLYKASGLPSRALSTFRRLLEVQPDHEQALLETAELAPPADPPPSGGLLKKLLGRR